MPRKRNSKRQSRKNIAEEISEGILPQNIVNFGEHVVEDKNIYIAQSVYKDIHKFTKDKTENESGGVLVGNVIEEFGKTNIIIRGFVEAKYCEGTPTTLKFTHETWEYVHGEIGKKYPKYKILGWIHTHPDFGIFLSEYDKFIQENFFKEENQIAYVVDPIQKIEGFYFWINGKIERCKGFFVFDKVGTEITVSDKVEAEEPDVPVGIPKLAKILIGVLSGAVALLIILCLSLNGKISNLQDQMETLVNSANQSLSYMSIQVNSLYGEIDDLKARVKALEPEETTDQDETGEDTSSETDESTDTTDSDNNTQDSEANTESAPEEGSEEVNDNE